MKLKKSYARFKMVAFHHLWRIISKCFLKPLWFHKKIRKDSFRVKFLFKARENFFWFGLYSIFLLVLCKM